MPPEIVTTRRLAPAADRPLIHMLPVIDADGDVTLEFTQEGEATPVARAQLKDLLAGARLGQSLSIQKAAVLTWPDVDHIHLSPIEVLQCAIFAQDQQVSVLRQRIAGMHTPTVLLEINGGVINQVRSDSPVTVIVLDEDIEGADEDGIVSVNGVEAYLSRYPISKEEATAEAGYIRDVLDQLNEGPAEAPHEAP